MPIALILLTILITSAPAATAQVCEDSTLGPCRDLSLTETSAHGYRCLELHLACGQYEPIVFALTSEALVPDSHQKYFLGSALYHLKTRYRNRALRCHYANAARNTLENYLASALSLYSRQGNLGKLNIKHVGHARKVIEILKSEEGCRDFRISHESIERLAKSESHLFVRDAFFRRESEGHPGIHEAFKEIDELNSSFVSGASAIDLGIDMGQVEIQIASDLMKNIQATYLSSFGGSASDLLTTPELNQLDSLWSEKNLTSKKIRDDFSEALSRALGPSENVTGEYVDSYPQKREETIGRTLEVLPKMTGVLQQFHKVHGSGAIAEARTLLTLAQETSPRQGDLQFVNRIHKQWYETGIASFMCIGGPFDPSEPWFCQWSEP